MAEGTRIIKFSVLKDQKLLEEKTFESGEILVGHFARAELRIDDDAVERRHVSVTLRPDGSATVENLVSAEKTRLNDAPLEGKATLKSGDHLDVGPYRVVVAIRQKGEEESVKDIYARSVEEQRIEGGTRALEVAMFWEGTLLSVNHYQKLHPVTVGEGKSVDYFAPEEALGAPNYRLVVPHNGKYAVNFKSKAIQGDVLIGEKIYTVAELRAANLLTDGDRLTLDATMRCRLNVDNISFLISYTTLPPKPKRAWFARVSLQEHIYTSISLIAHILFLIILSLIPEEQLVAQRDPYQKKDRTIQVMKMAQDERKEDEEEKKKIEEEEEKKDGDKAEKEGDQNDEVVEVVEEPEKQPKIKPKDTSRRPTDDIASKLEPHKMREYNERVARETGVSKVFDQQTDLIQDMMGSGSGLWGGGSRGLRTIGSRGAGDAGGAAGSFFTGAGGLSPFGGSLGGPGGGGFRGTALSATIGGPGGSGGEEIAGLGKEGNGGKGDGKIHLRDRAQKVRVVSGTLKVKGGLDKATIRRYIRTKIPQVRWCYRNELQKVRTLKGKITVEFVIAPTGKVLSSKIAGTTMNNRNVEQCILTKVRTWHFPPSKQKSAARVRYPFIFKTGS